MFSECVCKTGEGVGVGDGLGIVGVGGRGVTASGISGASTHATRKAAVSSKTRM
jgi:hypothetical protein